MAKIPTTLQTLSIPTTIAQGYINSTYEYKLFGYTININYFDTTQNLIYAQLNVLGYEYYLELKKLGYTFHGDILDAINKEGRSYKLKKILNKK